MTEYLQIRPIQQPFNYGVDENERALFSCNYNASIAGATSDTLREFAKLINDAGLGTLNTDMFIGIKRPLPTDGSGPYVRLIDTGGLSPDYVHNSSDPNVLNVSVQVVVIAKSYEAGNTRALAIWDMLKGVDHQTVVA